MPLNGTKLCLQMSFFIGVAKIIRFDSSFIVYSFVCVVGDHRGVPNNFKKLRDHVVSSRRYAASITLHYLAVPQ